MPSSFPFLKKLSTFYLSVMMRFDNDVDFTYLLVIFSEK